MSERQRIEVARVTANYLPRAIAQRKFSEGEMKTEPMLLDAISVGVRHRPVNDDAVDRLVESISRIGLLTPITVHTPDDGRTVWLVAGHHRLAAMKRLGWEMVDVFVFYGDDIEIELREIAENLHREDLTVLERSDHTARWIELKDVKTVSGQVAPKPNGGRPEGGLSAATRELGVERTEARRAIKVASLSDDAKAAAVEHGLDDNQSALLAAARESDPDKQVAKIAERAAKPKPKRETPKDADGDIAPPEVIDNIMHAIGRINANSRMFKKHVKLSDLDREAAVRINFAMEAMIKKWQSIQTTLEKKDCGAAFVRAFKRSHAPPP
jgi:ParB-like chromosome segregation protein Spo0J